MIYFLVLFYIIYLIYRFDYNKNTNALNKHYYFLAIVFICVAGLSYRLGGDSIMYERYFYQYFGADGFTGLFSEDMFRTTREPLWVLLNSVILSTFNEFQVLKFVISLFVNGTIFWFVKKHSTTPFTTIFLYAIFQFFSYNFQILRESLAIAFFLIAFDQLVSREKRKYLLYYLWIIPAMLFHHGAFIALLYPLCTFIKAGKKFYVVLAIMVLLSSSLNLMFGDLSMYLSLFDDISDMVEHYSEHETYGSSFVTNFSIVGIVAWLLLDIIPILFFINKSDDNVFKSMGLSYFLIFVLQTTSVNILYRISGFIFIPAAIALSSGINNTVYSFKYKIRNISVACVLLLAIMVGQRFRMIIINPQIDEYYPYSSIIFKSTDSVREQRYMNF